MAEPSSGAVSGGDWLWFRSADGEWHAGRVVRRDGDSLRVIALSEDSWEAEEGAAPYVVRAEETQTFDGSHKLLVDDVTRLNNLNAAPLLSVLRRRFTSKQIYTFCGELLISLNPYELVPGLYDMPERLAHPPHAHVYNIALRAYTSVCSRARSQALLVSGESGAGKTEACKKVMKYLAALSAEVNGKPTQIEQRVLETNPLLEAFGNAKTIRNDNSSRFGKFLKIYYSDKRILGGGMDHYLLEKSRIVGRAEGERSYHIFYQLCKGADAELREQLALGPVEDFRYLGMSGCMDVDGMDDVAEFEAVRHAMASIGITNRQATAVWQLLAAVLHVGNISFLPGSDDFAFTLPTEDMEAAERLMGCRELEVKLVERRVVIKGRDEEFTVKLTVHQAEEARDSLAKAVYGALFEWIVNCINRALDTGVRGDELFIGILDIFGFEIFDVNSFEQLCINYANERLQCHFNDHIFVQEQAMYIEEGVDVTAIEFRNNTECVRLIDGKRSGVLSLLDEQCRLGVSDKSDRTFLSKLDKLHKEHEFYEKHRFSAKGLFGVKHFAGVVHYFVDGFAEKNRDAIHDDMREMLSRSSHSLLSGFFAGSGESESKEESGGGRRSRAPTTAGGKFKAQLDTLVDVLRRTDPHFIRCIKPNTRKAAFTFQSGIVIDQMMYAGIFEVVRIRRLGYPFRLPFDDFLNQFIGRRYARHGSFSTAGSARERCVALMADALPPDLYQIGYRQVFMRDGARDKLRDWLADMVATYLQHVVRTWLTRRAFLQKRRAALSIQRAYSAHVQRERFKTIQAAFIKAQAHIRGWLVRSRVEREKREKLRKVTLLQSCWRRHTARRSFLATRACAVHWQRLFRGWKGRQRAGVRRYNQGSLRILAAFSLAVGQLLSRPQRHRRLQRNVRGWLSRRLTVRRDACKRLLRAAARNCALSVWLSEVHASATWGLVDELRSLLTCERSLCMRSIPDRVNIRSRSEGLRSALHAGALSGSEATVKLLLRHGADLMARDGSGQTALHSAVTVGDDNLPVVKLLVGRSLPPEQLLAVSDRSGETALDVAIACQWEEEEPRYREVITFLRRAGCPSTSFVDVDAEIDNLYAHAHKGGLQQLIENEELLRRRHTMRLTGDPHYQYFTAVGKERKLAGGGGGSGGGDGGSSAAGGTVSAAARARLAAVHEPAVIAAPAGMAVVEESDEEEEDEEEEGGEVVEEEAGISSAAAMLQRRRASLRSISEPPSTSGRDDLYATASSFAAAAAEAVPPRRQPRQRQHPLAKRELPWTKQPAAAASVKLKPEVAWAVEERSAVESKRSAGRRGLTKRASAATEQARRATAAKIAAAAVEEKAAPAKKARKVKKKRQLKKKKRKKAAPAVAAADSPAAKLDVEARRKEKKKRKKRAVTKRVHKAERAAAGEKECEPAGEAAAASSPDVAAVASAATRALAEVVPAGTGAAELAMTSLCRALAVLSGKQDGDAWFYVDDSGEQQGPFPAASMRSWAEAGYFAPDVMVRQGQLGPFLPLDVLFPRKDAAFSSLPDRHDVVLALAALRDLL